MAAYDLYCRAPLVDPAYVPLPDSAVHTEGKLETLIQSVLAIIDPQRITPIDQVLATKLGGYTELPVAPALAALDPLADPKRFISTVRAGMMIAAASKDKDAMLSVLSAMRAFTDALPSMDEALLLSIGADALRVVSELYRRTGQRFLLTLLERLRSQLPDVSGMFHSFPFLKAFVPEKIDPAATDETAQYYRRLERLGTGKLTADALSITASLALYSGSARDASASKAGVTALQRYHGFPNGAFSADPYLAGRDPSRAVDLPAACAQIEALCDLLAASGDLSFADRLETLVENTLRNFIAADGVRGAQAVNCLASDPILNASSPTPEQTTALLSALLALRRSMWMVKSESELALLLPFEGCCLVRMDGVPVRVTSTMVGENAYRLSLETKQPVEFALSVRIPAYASAAQASVNDGKGQIAESRSLYTLKRTFKTGDTVTVRLSVEPRVETGYRGSASVYYGPSLLALPLPDENAAWQYAIDAYTALSCEVVDGRTLVHVDACNAPSWASRNGTIPPLPQGLPMGDGYVLTLLPYAETNGRIAAFPQTVRRA